MIEKGASKLHFQRVKINFYTNETKYYLLTEGSGYPLAEFSSPNLSEQAGGFVIPEHRPKTSN